MVVAFGVDFGLGPAEDPEGVIGSEIGQRKGDGARPGFPIGRIGEEFVAYEVVVGRFRRRVDS